MTNLEIIEENAEVQYKLIFFYLLSKNNLDFETSFEKAKLMSYEKVENLFEEIFINRETLPKIIFNLHICSLKLISQSDELEPLINDGKLSILYQKTISSNQNEQNLQVAFKQNAVLEINLKALFMLKTISSNLSKQILEFISKKFPFTKSFIEI